VIFNHPHLGTEDTLFNSRFLAHLFHVSTGRWMKPNGGLLHLTLVIGQCERSRCLEWANRHGLVLIRRGKFVPPPSPPPPPATAKSNVNAKGGASGRKAAGGGGGGKTYYSLRRHQSGRSFANWCHMQGDGRCGGGGGGGGVGGGSGQGNDDSKTLVFGRVYDRPTPSTCNDADISTDMLLPRERGTPPSNGVPREETVVHLHELEGWAKSVIPAIREPRGTAMMPMFPCKGIHFLSCWQFVLLFFLQSFAFLPGRTHERII